MNNLQQIDVCCSEFFEYSIIRQQSGLSLYNIDVVEGNIIVFSIRDIQPEQLNTIKKVLTKLNTSVVVNMIYNRPVQERIQHYITANNIHVDIDDEFDDVIILRNEYDDLTHEQLAELLFF